MKPGDLVRLKDSKKENIGVIIEIRRSVTDFQDSSGEKPYVYARVLWDRNPFSSMKVLGSAFEIATHTLEVISEAG